MTIETSPLAPYPIPLQRFETFMRSAQEPAVQVDHVVDKGIVMFGAAATALSVTLGQPLIGGCHCP